MFAEGQALGEEGLRIAEAVDHPASLVVAYWGIGLLSLRQGDLPRALPCSNGPWASVRTRTSQAYSLRLAAALGAAYTLAGRIADAVPLLTQAMEQTMATEMVDFQALCRLPGGGADAGWPPGGGARPRRACAGACRAHQERGNQAYALRLLGDIAARREPPEVEQAEAHYRQALALAEELGMRPLQAHCHRGLGTLYATIGQQEQARAELSTAIELYRAMDMTFWLPQAEAALAQVETEGTRSSPHRTLVVVWDKRRLRCGKNSASTTTTCRRIQDCGTEYLLLPCC